MHDPNVKRRVHPWGQLARVCVIGLVVLVVVSLADSYLRNSKPRPPVRATRKLIPIDLQNGSDSKRRRLGRQSGIHGKQLGIRTVWWTLGSRALTANVSRPRQRAAPSATFFALVMMAKAPSRERLRFGYSAPGTIHKGCELAEIHFRLNTRCGPVGQRLFTLTLVPPRPHQVCMESMACECSAMSSESTAR